MTLHPTPPSQRNEGLDVLRGAALFGVLLENLSHFAQPTYEAYAASPAGGDLDRAVLWGIRFLCDNKIYLLFSFLFGGGIALQMARAAASRSGFVGLHLWRMFVLALIGLAHARLLWNGDILFTYALLGVALLPLRRAPDRALGAVAVLFLLAPTLLLAGLAAWLHASPPAGAALARLQADTGVVDYPIRQSCFAFAAFALGLAAGRAGLLVDSRRLLARARPYLPAAALLGLAANAAMLWAWIERQSPVSADAVAVELGAALGTPCLALVYACAVLAAEQRPAWRPRLRPLAAVGRMSLSNYLLQSALGAGVLAHTGLGPLGTLTPPAGVAVTVLIFGAQVAASGWWLARFRFGPAEWVWRTLAYGELQPWRIAGRAAPAAPGR